MNYTPPQGAMTPGNTVSTFENRVGADNEPHAKRGRLKNGNPAGDLSKAPRCGAKTRQGSSCRGPAMRNGRCRMHGGRSTGPKTSAGLRRSRKARWKTGKYSAKSKRAYTQTIANLRSCGRFSEMLTWYDRMIEHIEDIEHQIDCWSSTGLQAKCVTALKMWRNFQAVVRERDALDGTRRRRKSKLKELEETMSLMLEAGAIGQGPVVMNRILERYRPKRGWR